MTAQVARSTHGELGAHEVRLFRAGRGADYRAHVATFGALPELAAGLGEQLELSGLTGRGGAGFPVFAKLRDLAGPPIAIIGNGAEGEPCSAKDRTLIEHSPHLVLDGLVALGRQYSSDARLVVYTHAELLPRLRAAVSERSDCRRVEIAALREDRFVAGEASAVVSALGGGKARPADKVARLTQVGLKKRPTLLFNVETLAHVALVARWGGEWFRGVGDPRDPGTRLVTIGDRGLPHRVIEVASGASLMSVVAQASVDIGDVAAALVGGYHGSWVPRSDFDQPLWNVRDAGIAAGAGVIQLLSTAECPLVRSNQIVQYLAAQTAKQCGPCRFGLPALATDFAAIVVGDASSTVLERVESLIGSLPGRGACHHPDGSVRFVASTLPVFAEEADRHSRGHCSGRREQL